MEIERIQIKAMAEHYFQIYRKSRPQVSWETFFQAFEIGLASGLDIASYVGTDKPARKELANQANSIKYFNQWNK